MKLLSLLAAAVLTLSMFSCKKEKTDDSLDGRFQGLWEESSEKKVTLVVTKDPSGAVGTPNLFLNIDDKGYPFYYKFNAAGDIIYLTSAAGADIPFEIHFSEDSRTVTIEKFHEALPDTDPVTFKKK